MGEQKNRRRFTRVAVDLQVEVQSGGRTLHGVVAGNLSMSGVLLRTAEELAKDAPCRLRIPAGEAEVLAEARVVRVYPGALAFEFTRLLGPDSFGHLRSLVMRNAPDPELAGREAKDAARGR